MQPCISNLLAFPLGASSKVRVALQNPHSLSHTIGSFLIPLALLWILFCSRNIEALPQLKLYYKTFFLLSILGPEAQLPIPICFGLFFFPCLVGCQVIPPMLCLPPFLREAQKSGTDREQPFIWSLMWMCLPELCFLAFLFFFPLPDKIQQSNWGMVFSVIFSDIFLTSNFWK